MTTLAVARMPNGGRGEADSPLEPLTIRHFDFTGIQSGSAYKQRTHNPSVSQTDNRAANSGTGILSRGASWPHEPRQVGLNPAPATILWRVIERPSRMLAHSTGQFSKRTTHPRVDLGNSLRGGSFGPVTQNTNGVGQQEPMSSGARRVITSRAIPVSMFWTGRLPGGRVLSSARVRKACQAWIGRCRKVANRGLLPEPALSPKTGYVADEDNSQVADPTHFRASATCRQSAERFSSLACRSSLGLFRNTAAKVHTQGMGDGLFRLAAVACDPMPPKGLGWPENKAIDVKSERGLYDSLQPDSDTAANNF